MPAGLRVFAGPLAGMIDIYIPVNDDPAAGWYKKLSPARRMGWGPPDWRLPGPLLIEMELGHHNLRQEGFFEPYETQPRNYYATLNSLSHRIPMGLILQEPVMHWSSGEVHKLSLRQALADLASVGQHPPFGADLWGLALRGFAPTWCHDHF